MSCNTMNLRPQANMSVLTGGLFKVVIKLNCVCMGACMCVCVQPRGDTKITDSVHM